MAALRAGLRSPVPFGSARVRRGPEPLQVFALALLLLLLRCGKSALLLLHRAQLRFLGLAQRILLRGLLGLHLLLHLHGAQLHLLLLAKLQLLLLRLRRLLRRALLLLKQLLLLLGLRLRSRWETN